MSNESPDALSIRRFDASNPSFPSYLASLSEWNVRERSEITNATARIIEDVRLRGDHALIELTNQFDNRSATSFDDLVVDKHTLQTS